MTCRHCGARIGILERWRYGEFCSREHKDEFALENERLTEEILRDLRRPLAPNEPVPIASAAAAVDAPEPEPQTGRGKSSAGAPEEPEPEMAGTVAQQWSSALKARQIAAVEEPPRTKPGWKEFASLANLDRATSGGVKATVPAYRLLWVQDAPPPQPGPYVRVLKRTLGLPYTHYRRRRPGLRLFDILLPIDPPPDTPPAILAEEPVIWGGWELNRESGSAGLPQGLLATGPGIDEVLAAYPLTAPWDRWEHWPVGAPAPLAQRPQDTRFAPPPPGTQAEAPAENGSQPSAPARPAARPGAAHPGPAVGPGGMIMPASPVLGGGRPAQTRIAHAAPARRAPGPSPASPHLPAAYPGVPAFSQPAMPAFAGPASGQPASAGHADHHGGSTLGTAVTAHWREMAPPLFLAQADPAAGLDPLDRPRFACPLPSRFVHSRPRIFRPRPHLPSPQTRVPSSGRRLPVALRLADGWTPSPAEPVRWRP